MDRKELISIIAILAVLLGIFYPYNANLQDNTFAPPTEITDSYGNYFNFKVHNYGEKSASYTLEVSSEEFLVKIDSALNPEYEHYGSIRSFLEDEEASNWKINIKANESNLPPKASVKFTYTDTSNIIFKDESTWNLFYEQDGSQKYHFINQSSNKRRFIALGN